MIINVVEYEDDIKITVDNYNARAYKDKDGKYWNKTENEDKEVYAVKKHIKDHYIEEQKYICPYCLQKIVVDHNAIWDAEHIIPKDEHPQFLFTPQNLCVSCKDCNMEKSNKKVLKKNPKRNELPSLSDDYLIVHPHFDIYDRHIKVLKDSLLFIPKNDKGRKTIEICGLLRFVYKYANDIDIPTKVKKKIDDLNNSIQSSKGQELIYSLFLLRELTDRLIKENV